MATKKKLELPEVNFSDYGDTRYLHLGTPWVQGSMNIDKPFDIDLEYVQRMMAWLLFVDIDKVGKLHAMQFKLPADSAKLQVVLGDAAEVAKHDHWRGQIDALQVDLYDHEAASPVLDSAEFYADCRQLLTDEGCMTVNLFGRSSSFAQSVEKMAKAFGEDALWAFKPTREGNTVVLAQRTPSHPKRAELMARAEAIQARWPLPATKWMRVFKPLQAL